ncbi:MAG: neutral zinc metallopeptidase [Myxococcota bacterium]
MKWTRGNRSGNLEDLRGQFSGTGGGGLRLPGGRGGIGLGGVVLVLAIAYYTGQNPLSLLAGIDDGSGAMPPDVAASVGAGAPVQESAAEAERADFMSFVLDDAQATWQRLLPGYRDAKLVLFRDGVRSGCGNAESAMGPFYCPADERVYVDLGFFDELARRFGAPGDFAQAYVLAHEIGHHVQNLTGTERKLRELQRASPEHGNALSVRMELQADCYAGVWAHSTSQRDLLERGDLDEGLSAASAVGDDRIQQMSGSGVHPESFTHGSAAQRTEWFRRGYETGDAEACDTFAS